MNIRMIESRQIEYSNLIFTLYFLFIYSATAEFILIFNISKLKNDFIGSNHQKKLLKPNFFSVSKS